MVARSGYGWHRLTDTLAPPSAYTPRHLADRILQSRSTIEGERKFVTVLFADIQGSTAMIEPYDAERVIHTLDPVLKAMIFAVHRFEGTVNRVQGDGIMALFGAPLAHEDHALRGCYAALAMQEAVKKQTNGAIAIRVGLHSGQVVVRSISNDLSTDYDAVGSTVSLAARMEQLAAVGKVRITNDTYRLIRGFIETRPLGAATVKGLSRPIDVYELVESPTVKTNWQVRLERGLAKFVGREHELETLARTLRKAQARNGQVIAVVGEPGVGKSRLVHEFVDTIHKADWTVLETSGLPEGKRVPYLPITTLLSSWLGLDDDISLEDTDARLRERIVAHDESLLAFLAPLQALLNLKVGDELWGRLGGADRRQRIQRALAALALQIAGSGPLVLLVEDLHWVDEETLAALDAIVDSLGASPFLLIVTYRPEFAHNWQTKPYYDRIRLDPLDEYGASQLLDDLLGVDQSLIELKSLLFARSEGVPLFMEEFVGALKESGSLTGQGDDYRLAIPIRQIDIPATVEAVIAARIDRLSPESKDLLQIASVIGKVVRGTLLEEVAGLIGDDFLERLAGLQGQGFLFETKIVPEAEYEIRHSLIKDVAYGSILSSRQRALHAGVVRAIEQRFGNRLDRHVSALAFHAQRAHLWEETATYARRAGTQALERSAFREAIAWLEQTLAALTHLPDGHERTEQEIDALLELRAALSAEGTISPILPLMDRAEIQAEGLGDQRRLAAVKFSQTFAYNFLGRPDEAKSAARKGLQIARKLRIVHLEYPGLYHLAQAQLWSGAASDAVDTLRSRLGDITGPLRDKRIGTAGTTSVAWLGLLGSAEAYLGRFEDSLAHVEEARTIAAEPDPPLPYDQVLADWYLGFVLSHRGEHRDAMPVLEAASTLCLAANITLLQPAIELSLGYVHALAGQLNDAAHWLSRALELARRTEFSFAHVWSSCHLAWVELLRGNPAKAIELAQESYKVAADRGHRGVEPAALRILAEASVQHGAGDAVLAKAERNAVLGLELAEHLGLGPYAAHCHLTMAKIRHRFGDTEGGRQHAESALGRYDEMAMAYWAQEAKSFIKASAGP